LFVAGDWCTSSSINGALLSGRLAAEAELLNAACQVAFGTAS
jgi:predicted NAD/FAD-dependent oxidoreductase